MRSLKDNIGFILALIAILASVEFSFLSDKIVKNYEQLMANDYNIIIVSNKELLDTTLKPIIPTFASLEILGPQKILERLSNDVSAKNLSILQNALPKFYSLRLNAFPSSDYMNQIRAKILKLDGVSKVETFSKTHDKVYKILNITRSVSYVFMGLIALIGTLLMSRQISLWIYKHKERIEIMSLFGAPFMLKSAVLYKSAILDSILSTAIVVCLFKAMPSIQGIQNLLSQVDLIMPQIELKDMFILFGIALTLGAFVVSIVMARAK
ncbi:cell division protein FtsX [Campylobacter mucosalis]|uniref:cell division protein FtsX n=1 Tax=Campylobacter mucosalis TaxID=202 RepID=UPI00147001C2|nr:cell division protein FtsX [Campylobacter mucosalis]